MTVRRLISRLQKYNRPDANVLVITDSIMDYFDDVKTVHISEDKEYVFILGHRETKGEN